MKHPVEQLCDAAAQGDLLTVARLLDEGVDPTAKNGRGRTPIRLAAENGQVGVLQLFEARGANLQLRDPLGRSLLHTAGTPETVRWLVGRGLDVNSGTAPTTILEGRTPLMTAASEGLTEVVRALLDSGADRDARDPRGATALTHALQSGKDETAAALIEMGARAGLIDAALRGDVPAVQSFLPTSPEMMGVALRAAASRGRIQVIDLLINAGVSPDARSDRGSTALSKALHYRQAAAAEALLARGADPNLPDSLGKPPIMWAAMVRDPVIVRILLARGADVNATDRKDATALVWAVSEGALVIAQILLEAGANTDIWGSFPLEIAAEHGQLEMMRLLYSYGAGREQKPKILTFHKRVRGEALRMMMEHGADPNLMDMFCWTSLMYSAQGGDISTIQLLLDFGADINARDPAGTTPLMIAAAWRQPGAYHAILSRGADPDLHDIGGLTAAEWGAEDEG